MASWTRQITDRAGIGSGLELQDKVPSDIEIAQAAACKPITEIFKAAGFLPSEVPSIALERP